MHTTQTMSSTGDSTADFLLRQLRMLARVGDTNQRQSVTRWELIVRTHAIAEEEEQPIAVGFATEHKQKDGQ